jgi:DNA invertase Pin-like site-specific DNA recombinase
MITKKKKAVLYTRVSTVEQEEGASLRYQEEQLRNYCDRKDWEVISCFTDKESGRDFDRKEFLRLHSFIKENKGDVDYVLVTRWDRFGRNQHLTVKTKTDFKKLGVTVCAIEQTIDESIPEHKLIENIQYTLDEIESDKISIRVKASNYKYAKEGAYLNRVPFGYVRSEIDNRASMAISEDAAMVKEAFLNFSTGNYSAEALRKELNIGVCKQTFINILRNKVYAGYVKVPAFKGESEYWVKGLHEPIVDLEVFKQVQNILNGNQPIPIRIAKKENQFFLRGHVICPYCNRPFTASRSKGRTGYYSYYHCDSKYGCHQRIAKDEFEGKLMKAIGSFKVKESVEKLYNNIFKTMVVDKTKYITRKANEIENQIKVLNEKIVKNQDLLIEGQIDAASFQSINQRYMDDKNKLQAEQLRLKSQTGNEAPKKFNEGVSVLKGFQRVMATASPRDRSLIKQA